MLSFALLELCGPDASGPMVRSCVGLFPFRDLLLSRAPVLFGAPPEYTEPDASAPTVRSCARDKESLPDASLYVFSFSITVIVGGDAQLAGRSSTSSRTSSATEGKVAACLKALSRLH